MLRRRKRHHLLTVAALVAFALPVAAQTEDAALPSPVTFQRAELRHRGKDEPRVLWLARMAAERRRPIRLDWAKNGADDPFAKMTMDVQGTPAMMSLHVADPEKWTRVMESLLAASTCPCSAWGPFPGRTPDGKVFRGSPLRVAKSGGNLQLTWGESCSDAATDYSVHRGIIGSWYSHTAVDCSTGGNTNATVAGGAGSAYFLIVPTTDNREGSYGVRSNRNERPGSLATCRSEWTTQQCTSE